MCGRGSEHGSSQPSPASQHQDRTQAGLSPRGLTLQPLAMLGAEVPSLSDNSHAHRARPCSKCFASINFHREPWREELVPTLQMGKLRPRDVTCPGPDS